MEAVTPKCLSLLHNNLLPVNVKSGKESSGSKIGEAHFAESAGRLLRVRYLRLIVLIPQALRFTPVALAQQYRYDRHLEVLIWPERTGRRTLYGGVYSELSVILGEAV